jgi:hypothetical protein
VALAKYGTHSSMSSGVSQCASRSNDASPDEADVVCDTTPCSELTLTSPVWRESARRVTTTVYVVLRWRLNELLVMVSTLRPTDNRCVQSPLGWNPACERREGGRWAAAYGG